MERVILTWGPTGEEDNCFIVIIYVDPDHRTCVTLVGLKQL